jgi:hypothetical protein
MSGLSADVAASGAVLLQKVMRAAGWEIEYIDLDLTGNQPKADIKLTRGDGLWVLARVDHLGRATIERFQREMKLGKPRGAKGRFPLSPQIEDIFLGRLSGLKPRTMLRALTSYIADNALHPVALTDVRNAWRAVMSSPLRLSSAAPEVR